MDSYGSIRPWRFCTFFFVLGASTRFSMRAVFVASIIVYSSISNVSTGEAAAAHCMELNIEQCCTPAVPLVDVLACPRVVVILNLHSTTFSLSSSLVRLQPRPSAVSSTGSSLSRRYCCHVEPSMRGREKTLVRVDVGATARVAGVLQGMPERPDVERACRQRNTSQSVVSSHENTQLEKGPPLVLPHTSRNRLVV